MRKIVLSFFILLVFLAVVSASDFEVDTPIIKAVIEKRDAFDASFNIFNSGEKRLFSVNSFSEYAIFSISESEFYIGESENKKIRLSFNSSDFSEGVFVGEIVVSDGSKSIKIPVILEIQTQFPLFDASIRNQGNSDSKRKFVYEVSFYKLKGISDLVNADFILNEAIARLIINFSFVLSWLLHGLLVLLFL